MGLEGKKVAVLIDNLYEDNEFWYPYFRLKEEGAEVVAVGSESGTEFKSKHGYPKICEMGKTEAAGKKWDGVIIPGGYAPDIIRRYPELVGIVKDTMERGGIVAAICHGPWVLCSAGVLKGKQATCFFAIKDDIINAGAEYVDREVVVDGGLITSRKPDDLPAFMVKVIASLKER